LSIALARIRSAAVQSLGPPGSSGEPLLRRLARRAKAQRARTYLGAALSIILIGIGVNALVLQRGRHPAPLFGQASPSGSTSTPTQVVAPAPQTAGVDKDSSAAEVPSAAPPARPTESLPAAAPARPPESTDAPSSRSSDPIADLLHEEAHSNSTHLILAAQTALVKLGYPVKPDGNESASTQQALRDFERAHGLPPSTDITPRLVKQLMLAARSATR
jgi:hypothetical protein